MLIMISTFNTLHINVTYIGESDPAISVINSLEACMEYIILGSFYRHDISLRKHFYLVVLSTLFKLGQKSPQHVATWKTTLCDAMGAECFPSTPMRFNANKCWRCVCPLKAEDLWLLIDNETFILQYYQLFLTKMGQCVFILITNW